MARRVSGLRVGARQLELAGAFLLVKHHLMVARRIRLLDANVGAPSYGRASKIRLNGVSAARRKRVKPASPRSARHVASGTCGPSS